LNQCGEALQIARTILERVPSDALAVENANEIVNRCQQNLERTPEPPATPSDTATPAPTPTP
jgi:hypothetical protein